ncbi:MAG TPA: DinB family protein [Jiangellaceae bacterium]
MRITDILVDAFGRVREIVHQVVRGRAPEQLAYRVDGEANSIAWLIWHLTRIQDDHVADVADTEQVWTAGGWSRKFGLPFAPSATGYGHSSDDVAAVQVRSGDLLTGYYDAVHDMTIRFLNGLTDADYTRIVDRSWDPPVTLAVRLVSVVSDDLQHAGQAAFIAGVEQRQRAST